MLALCCGGVGSLAAAWGLRLFCVLRLQGAWASAVAAVLVPLSLWDPPGPGMEPVCPLCVADGFLSTGSPGSAFDSLLFVLFLLTCVFSRTAYDLLAIGTSLFVLRSAVVSLLEQMPAKKNTLPPPPHSRIAHSDTVSLAKGRVEVPLSPRLRLQEEQRVPRWPSIR